MPTTTQNITKVQRSYRLSHVTDEQLVQLSDTYGESHTEIITRAIERYHTIEHQKIHRRIAVGEKCPWCEWTP